MKVDKDQVELEVGKTEKITVTEITTSKDGSKTEKDVTQEATYKVDDEEIVIVENGTITAKAPGSTTITITHNGQTVTVEVSVYKKELKVNKDQVELESGKTEKITVTEITTSKDRTKTEKDVTQEATYKVDNEEIVIVENGVITAKAPGTAIITIKYNGQTTTVEVSVYKKELKVDKATVELESGKTEKLTLTEITTSKDGTKTEDVTQEATYKIADEEVVAVTEGIITAKAPGSTTVTITHNGRTVTVEVSVYKKELKVDKATVELESGKTEKLTLTEITTSKDGTITEKDVTQAAAYKVDNEEIVIVENGVITAKAPGTATINIRFNGLEINVPVVVTKLNPGTPDPGTPNPGTPGPGTPAIPSPGPMPNPVPTNPNPTPTTPVFSDVKGHWASQYIEKAASLGLFKGFEDGTFKPNAPMTRVQTVSLIVRLLGIETDEKAPFTDLVNFSDETQAEIATAYKYGIIRGNTEFNPNKEITRAQLALMIYRLYTLKYGEYKPTEKAPFTDYAQYNEETQNAISMLYELQIISGNDGKFLPKQSATRSHIAKIFVNLMERFE